MKILIILITIFHCSLAFSKQETYGDVIPSEIRSVYDGDTFYVSIDSWPPIIGKSIAIRVSGVDTPEMRGKCDKEKSLARQAKKHTVEFLRSSGKVELRNIRRDKYFRILADVYGDGRSLTDSLTHKGLGYQYTGTGKQSWCK